MNVRQWDSPHLRMYLNSILVTPLRAQRSCYSLTNHRPQADSNSNAMGIHSKRAFSQWTLAHDTKPKGVGPVFKHTSITS